MKIIVHIDGAYQSMNKKSINENVNRIKRSVFRRKSENWKALIVRGSGAGIGYRHQIYCVQIRTKKNGQEAK